jgi:predicted NACHT family NTPase
MNRDTLIARLKEEIAVGRVVAIAGTGVSVAACLNQKVEGFRVATWTGLLQHGVKHLVEIGAANDRVASVLGMQVESEATDLIITAAETISQRMKTRSEGTFRGWLKDTIGRLKIADRAVPDVLAALPGVLATLNYDNLLEDATGRHAVTWLNTDAVQDVLTGVDPDAVLHLHGWFREPESVVLGLGSYLAAKDHPHAKAVLDLFMIDRTLLFVGCGDTVLDPNFSRLIEWASEALRDVAPRHYLLCRTPEIAAFQQKLARAPWLQPLAYGAEYPDLAPFLRGLAPDGDSANAKVRMPARASLDLAAYRQAMRKRYMRLKLEELDPTTHDVRPLTLTGMFIGQSAREAAEFMPRIFELPKELQRRLREQGEMEGGELDEELLAQHRRAYLDQSPRSILEVVRDPAFRRLVVLGDPGSGKSTLLQYLLLDWAEMAAPGAGDEPLPLLIELREYARLRHEGTVDGFLDYLHCGASVRWHLDRRELDAWLKNTPSHVLFDGLDEVFDPALRKEVSTAIHRFADEYPLARVVVTSRIIGYQHQAWRDEDFRHVMLQELDEGQIADFLVRWHRAAYDETGKGEAKRALLAGAIQQSAAIRQLAGNPLLLTMMAILNRTQDLPRDRAELYEQCARLLLHQWKVDVAFDADPELSKASLDYKDKRGLLLRVARAMQTSQQGLAGNLIGEDELEGTLVGGLEGVPNLRSDRAARALIEQLRGRNFMLCSLGGRSYAFVHRTFLEYFCAVEIRERFQMEQSLSLEQLKTEIFGHWADETWHEVLSLLAGMLAPRFVAEILDWLLARPDPEDARPHVFLAARCIGEVRRREELGSVERRVMARARSLTLFDLRHSYKERSDEQTTVTGIRARAVQVVAAVWRETADTRTWLKARAQSDETANVRSMAVQELARGWKDDPETVLWLKARVQSDENADVRSSAVEELARGWKDDPETLPILKARAQSDEDANVRSSAVWELAHGWKDDPETLPFLNARAQLDKHELVRMNAVVALARALKGDPDTLAILKARAQSDEHAYVRRIAVEELAHGWKDDAAVQAFLMGLKR